MGNVKANNSNSLNTYLEGAVCTSTANQTAVCRPGNLKKKRQTLQYDSGTPWPGRSCIVCTLPS